MACTAAPRSFAHTVHQHRPGQCAADMPVAAHAQQAARLLVKLRALERQRRGDALLGRRLRLGARLSARLVHLGTSAQSARRHEQDGRFQTLQLISIFCSMPPRAWHVQRLHAALHTQCTNTGQGSVLRTCLLPHMHSQLRACFTSSARSSASAAATRCSAAASASARASVRAWST